LRVVRSSSVTPSSSSSRATLRLIEDGGSPIASAARVKPPVSTTRTNVVVRFKSIFADRTIARC
jgi:hypothetical protein